MSLVNPPASIHQATRAAAPATSASPTRPAFVPPLPIGNGAVSASPERRPAVIFHPEEDDGDLVDSSSSSSIRDEERKEEESLEDGLLVNGLEQA